MSGDVENRIWHAAIVLAVFGKEFVVDFLKRIKSFTLVMKNGKNGGQN